MDLDALAAAGVEERNLGVGGRGHEDGGKRACGIFSMVGPSRSLHAKGDL